MTTELETTVDRKIVTFSLDKHAFGIDMRSLTEIREWEEPTPLPGVPGYILGVANLRGTVVPVVGLAERLGWQPSTIHPRSCLLVVNLGGKQAGFLVDEVDDIISVNEAQIQPAPDTQIDEPGVISGLVKVSDRLADASDDGRMVLLLDLAALGVSRITDVAA